MMRYAKIRKTDISNGPGVRVSLFVQGCVFHCPGCFNSETWDFNGGKDFSEDTLNVLMSLCNNPHIKGLSILGGEPFHPFNRVAVYNITKKFKELYPDKDLWVWTGYEYEVLPEDLLTYIDVLVDGQFEINKADPNLKYRGSANQRVIDVKKSNQQGRLIEINLV